jgi:hypothetical protein
VESAIFSSSSPRWKNTNVPFPGTIVLVIGHCSRVLDGACLALDIENIVLNVPTSPTSALSASDGEQTQPSGKKRKFSAVASSKASFQKCALHYRSRTSLDSNSPSYRPSFLTGPSTSHRVLPAPSVSAEDRWVIPCIIFVKKISVSTCIVIPPPRTSKNPPPSLSFLSVFYIPSTGHTVMPPHHLPPISTPRPPKRTPYLQMSRASPQKTCPMMTKISASSPSHHLPHKWPQRRSHSHPKRRAKSPFVVKIER